MSWLEDLLFVFFSYLCSHGCKFRYPNIIFTGHTASVEWDICFSRMCSACSCWTSLSSCVTGWSSWCWPSPASTSSVWTSLSPTGTLTNTQPRINTCTEEPRALSNYVKVAQVQHQWTHAFTGMWHLLTFTHDTIKAKGICTSAHSSLTLCPDLLDIYSFMFFCFIEYEQIALFVCLSSCSVYCYHMLHHFITSCSLNQKGHMMLFSSAIVVASSYWQIGGAIITLT